MTEKRFINRDESVIDIHTDQLVNASSEDGAEVFVSWLNELHKENEQLKNTNQELYDKLQETMSYKALKMGEVSILKRENEQLKQKLKSIEDSFKFSCTQNHIDFNKDKLKIEDAHTELTLKNGRLCISVFVSQLNEYIKFFYWVTGRKMEREFINYDGDVE